MDQGKIWTRARLGEPPERKCEAPARGRLALLLIALSVPVGGLAQQPSFGPLTFEEGAPLQRVSYAASSGPADVVGADGLRADLWLGYSNIFEQDSSATHVVFMDLERLLTVATIRWGASDRLELGGRLTLETTGGGVLDPFVLWYHERLGFGQANRDRFPEEAHAQRLTNGGTTRFIDAPPRTFGLDDLRAFAKWRALTSEDGRSVTSLRAEARIPAQANPAARESVDFGLTALGRLGVGSWYLHGMLGASTARASAALDPVLAGRSLFFMVGGERSLGSGFAVVAQYHFTSAAMRGFDHRELDWPSSNLVFGVAGRMGEAWRWDLSFQEDIPADTPAIDFTLGIRLSRRWR